MNIILWIFQIILAGACVFSGLCKIIFSAQKLVDMGQTGVEGLPLTAIRLIGISELLLAGGFVLPIWLHIAPELVPVSAGLFGLIMVLASIVHFKRFRRLGIKKERQNAINNLIVLVICIVVLAGRALDF